MVNPDQLSKAKCISAPEKMDQMWRCCLVNGIAICMKKKSIGEPS